MRRLVALALPLLLAGLVTAGCGGDDREEGAGSGPPVSLSGTTNDHGTKTLSGSLEVELDDFYFGPTFLKATPGQRVTIELHNEGKVNHTFTTTVAGSVDEELKPGEKKTVTVTAPQSGSALFICRFHQGQGMQGAIFVA